MNRLLSSLLVLLIFFGCDAEKEPVVSDGYLDINQTSIYYKTMGEGPPLVIVHGGPLLDQSYMVKHFKPLAQDYTLIFYDQRVSGKSAWEVDSTTLNLETFASDLDQLRLQLQLEKISVLGHSWGGFIAMNYALRYPENLDKLILSNSMPANNTHWQEEETAISQRMTERENQKIVEIYQRSEEVTSKTVEELMRVSFSTQFASQGFIDSLEISLPENYMDRSRIFQQMAPDLADFDLYPELAKLIVPTLIIYGDYEPSSSISAPLLHSTIPNSTLEIIENCGHFPFIEKPEEYFDLIEDFL